MKIIEVNFDSRKDKQLYKNFPFDLYKDTPNWVPPFESEMDLVLNPSKHPFYQHSTAKFFMALSEGDVVGRLAAVYNKNYAQFHHQNIGFFYYFESIQDQEVSNLLFSAALQWCKQHNIEKIIGPKGFLRSNGIGLLIKGFEFLPAVGIPYNMDYYQSLIENFGFKKHNDHYSGYLYEENKLPEKLFIIADKVKAKGNFWVKTFKNKKEMLPWIDTVDQVHHQAFHQNPNYYPSTKAEFNLLANNIRQIADPRFIKLIMFKDHLAGFIISYANISKAIQACRGKLFPFGWYTLSQAMKQTDLIEINGVGLLPQYQGLGANALLYSELEKTMRTAQVKQAELLQIDERNYNSYSDMEFLGVDWKKIHRTYQLSIF